MELQWEIAEPQPSVAQSLSEAVGISPLLCQVLINRGISHPSQAKAFLSPSREHLHDPFLLSDMDKAVRRIREAIGRKEKIFIFGDYDADGIAGTALLTKGLREMGAHVCFGLPHRLKEGYGLQTPWVSRIAQEGCSLLITVDNGISSFKEMKLARELGLDVIITDHHQLTSQSFGGKAKKTLELWPSVPECLAVINPKRPNSSYPFDGLSGAGVAYKVLQALEVEVMVGDFVALGTIADIVPLSDENRVFVKEGLEQLRQTSSLGLVELLKVCNLETKVISSHQVGFQIAPRINAVGRLGCAHKVIEALLTTSLSFAQEVALELEMTNRKRQQIEAQIYEQAQERLQEELDEGLIVLSDSRWHPGVIGIVASKLMDEYFRPTALIALDGPLGKGSVRSLGPFDISHALWQCRHLLERFGGHRHAAGFVIKAELIDPLKEALSNIWLDFMRQKPFIPSLSIDAAVSLDQIGPDLLEELSLLAPFGPSNPEPVFASLGVQRVGSIWTLKDKHLKFKVRDGQGVHKVIAFGMAAVREKLEDWSIIDIAYTPQKESWQGREGPVLVLKDVREGRGSK